MTPLRLFISHAHGDKPLADALQTLIAQVFPPGPMQSVKVDCSSDDAPGGGINPGARWLEWILNAVRNADMCVVILTADSVRKPWLTWEAGAVTGVAMSTASHSKAEVSTDAVVPLLFGVAVDDIPEPLRQQQAVNAEQTVAMIRFLYSLQQRAAGTEALDGPARQLVPQFVDEVQRILQTRLRERPATLRLSERSPIHLLNERSGLTLEPYRGAIADGVRLYCERFTGDLHQSWLLYPVADSAYRIVTLDRAKCLSIEGDSTRSDAAVLLWKYEAHESQHWDVLPNPAPANGASTVCIFNRASRLCLMPRPTDRQLVQRTFINVRDQDWWILAAPVLPSKAAAVPDAGSRKQRRRTGGDGT